VSGPLSGTVAVIAGGAGAVGEGIVHGFAAAGAQVVVPSRDPARLDDLRSRLGALPNLRTLVGDLGTAEGAADVRNRVLADYGRIDSVVASVGGWWQGADLVDVDAATWARLLANNLTSHFVVAQAFVPVLSERAGSSYLMIIGDAAEVPVRGSAPVSITTAGVLMMARTLAAESAGTPLRVNALVLGPLRTRARPTGRPEWLTADEVGAHAAHLASPGGAMVSGSIVRLLSRPAPPD